MECFTLDYDKFYSGTTGPSYALLKGLEQLYQLWAPGYRPGVTIEV